MGSRQMIVGRIRPIWAQKAGDTPQECVRWIADKYDLEEIPI